MSNQIRPGYMGLATINGLRIRCTSFTVNPNQDALFYDHVIGLKDTIPADSSTKGENLGPTYANTQKRIWRPSPISIGGGISFPATDNNLRNIFLLARYANYFDLDFMYYCKNGTTGQECRRFKDCRVNDFDFSVTSGDIVNVSMNVFAKNIEENVPFYHHTTPEKLITWDQSPVVVTSPSFVINHLHVNGINFKINNNVQNIYVARNISTTDSLLPWDLRVGMQEVTGSLNIYLESGYEFIPINLASPSVIQISFPGMTLSMSVVFKSNQIEGQVGPIITQLPFIGVDKVFTII